MFYALGCAFIACLLLYGLFVIPTRWLKIERVHSPHRLQIKALQISDLHVDMLRIDPDRIGGVIRRERPDFIFLTGDYTKKEDCLPRLDVYLKTIAAFGISTYAVLGNHDYKLPDPGKILDIFNSWKIPVLRNESVELERFRLVGIDDYDSGKSNIRRSFRQVRSDKPVIVLTHDPNVVPNIHRPFGYLMAGHLHGRQFNVPFFFKFKNKGALPSSGIYKGLHRNGYGTYYISKGIGQAGVNARFMVRSEVTVHYL